MRRPTNRAILLSAFLTTGVLLAGCASYSPYDYGYEGTQWQGPRRPHAGPLHGPGVAILDPWLLETEEGRAVVTLGFRDAARGFVTEDVAHRANIWFRRYADHDRDMKITDPEIRTALVQAGGRYLD